MTAPDPPDPRRGMREAVAHAAAAASVADMAARLTPLFADISWLKALSEALIAPLRADSDARTARQAARNGAVLTLTLADAPPVRLMLTLIEGEAERAAEAATGEETAGAPGIGFSGAQGLYRMLSRYPAKALFATAAPDSTRCRTRPILLRPGQWLMLDERRRSLRIPPQQRPILLLRARIERSPPPPVRRYALPEGRLAGMVQADDGFARSAMLLSVLREAGARQATPAIIALLDRTAGRERWTVMRELIALDAPAAWPHLRAMAARDPDDSVRAAARAVLRAGETAAEPCPA